MAPKPSAAGSNLSNYQHHGVSSAFGMITGGGGAYEDMLSAGVTSGSDFARKMYGSSLSKTTSLPTTGGDVGSGVVGVAGGGASSAFTKHTYEGSKSMVGSAAGSYSFGMPGNQGYMGAAYMGVSVDISLFFCCQCYCLQPFHFTGILSYIPITIIYSIRYPLCPSTIITCPQLPTRFYKEVDHMTLLVEMWSQEFSPLAPEGFKSMATKVWLRTRIRVCGHKGPTLENQKLQANKKKISFLSV